MKNMLKLTLVLAILSLVMAWVIGGDKADDSVAVKKPQQIRASAVYPIPENRDFGELLVSAFRYSPDEAGRVADVFRVLSYESVHGTAVTLENDAKLMVIGSALLSSGRVRFSTILKPGDTLIQGFVLNIGSNEALLGAYSIKPDSLLAVNFIDEKGDIPQFEIGSVPEILLADGGGCQTSCNTTCGPGYYACCYTDTFGCAHCYCVSYDDANPPALECTSGGRGATNCSLGGSTPR